MASAAEWVVTLDVVADTPGHLGVTVVERILEQLRGWEPIVLVNIDRYVLQLRVEATTPNEALALAACRHASAAREHLPTSWSVTRIEVVTFTEYQRTFASPPEIEALGLEPGPIPSSLPSVSGRSSQPRHPLRCDGSRVQRPGRARPPGRPWGPSTNRRPG